MNAVYVTGNEHKARLFNQMVGLDLEHVRADMDEIQSLDLRAVVEHKAKAAYKLLKRPVLVEDTKLVFPVLGALPGPLIKWFLEELSVEGLCRLLDGKERTAIAGAAIAYYDGEVLEIFEKELSGTIAQEPKGDSGFGWNRIFIPEGANLTLGQMPDNEFAKWYVKIKPFEELSLFLDNLEA